MVFLWNIDWMKNDFFIVVCKWNQRFASVLYYHQKNPHLIRTPIKSRKKRNGFFIVVNALVATKWLLMLGNFETLGSKFRHETAGLLPSFSTISKKSTSHTPSHTVTKKEKWIFYSSKHISSHQMATNVRKIRDLGSNFSHETAGLLASFSTIKKIHFSPSTRKKGQASLDLPITFLEITF